MTMTDDRAGDAGRGPDDRGAFGSSGVERELLGLIAALRETMSGFAATHAPPGDHPGGPADGLPTTCGVCPICLTIATLARSRPELIRHLTDAATSLTAALACLTHPETPASPGPSATADSPRSDPQQSPPEEPRRGSHIIDID